MNFAENAAVAINENEFFALCKSFDNKAIQLLWDLSNGLYEAEYFIQKVQENLEVYIRHTEYAIQKLTFFNVDEACDSEIWFWGAHLRKSDELYQLSFDTADGGQATLTFSHLGSEEFVYNVLSSNSAMGWGGVTRIAAIIAQKPEQYMNSREKKYAALLDGIGHLSDDFRYVTKSHAELSAVSKYFQEQGYSELLSNLEKLKAVYSNKPKRSHELFKLLTIKMASPKYEALWRKLYELIADSQKKYKSFDEIIPSPYKDSLQNKITSLLKTHGYSGEYPDFVKPVEITGAHRYYCRPIMGSKLLFGKHSVVSHIHCISDATSSYGYVTFVCGTQFLNNGESATDIYSCAFADSVKGGNTYDTVSYSDDEQGKTEYYIGIAVKKAELKKLSKKEASENRKAVNYKSLLLIAFMLGNIMTGLCLLGLMVMVLSDGGIDSLVLMPWWIIYAIGTVLSTAIFFFISVSNAKK